MYSCAAFCGKIAAELGSLTHPGAGIAIVYDNDRHNHGGHDNDNGCDEAKTYY